MSDPDIVIDVTQAWVEGTSEVTPVVIPDLRGRPVFALMPTDEKDREAIAAEHGVCVTCAGRGWQPIPWGKDMRHVVCPKCKGKTKGADHPEVRLAILRHICQGWEGWLTVVKTIGADGEEVRADGLPVPYTEEMLGKTASHDGAYLRIVRASQALKTEYREAEEKN